MIKRGEVIMTVLQYLKESGLIKSMIALEAETNVHRSTRLDRCDWHNTARRSRSSANSSSRDSGKTPRTSSGPSKSGSTSTTTEYLSRHARQAG